MSQREQFSSKVGFVLAAAGSAVGIGNLVGFPVNAAKSGGAAFLLIYALFVILICIPVMMAEMSLGRHTRLSPYSAYIKVGGSGWAIGGILGVITPFMIAVFYQVITVWILGYFVLTLSGSLDLLANPEYFGQFIVSNSIFLYMVLVLLMIGYVLAKGVQQGIERVARILMPMLFVMLIALITFVLTLDNALLGVKFYLVPDLSKINGSVISNAMSQAFFSLSLGMGILITYGSYVSQSESIPNASKWVALTDTGVAFCAGLLILPAIFAFNPSTNTESLSDSSISLIFTFLPKIFLSLQSIVGYAGASIFAAMFFLAVLFAALTSQISILQVPASALQDKYGYSRGKSLIILGIIGGIFALACSLSFGRADSLTNLTHYAGLNKSLFDVIYDIFYDTILPLNGFIICIFVAYKWRMAAYKNELAIGDDNINASLFQKYCNFAIRTFIPLILLLVFLNTVAIKFFWQRLLILDY